MTSDDQVSDLGFARGVPEVHRTRARSAAALISTAAGAIAAGILFSPFGRDLTICAVMAALVALVAMVVGVAFYLSASVFFLDEEPNSGSRLWRALWRRRPEQKPSRSLDADDVDEVLSHIAQRTAWGSVLSAFGAAAFVAAVILGIAFPRYDSVTIEFVDTPAWKTSSICPDLPNVFAGEVRHSELSSATPFVPVQVDATVCSTSTRGQVLLHLDRASVNILVN